MQKSVLFLVPYEKSTGFTNITWLIYKDKVYNSIKIRLQCA